MHYILARYNVAKRYCEAINRALDLGYLVFDDENQPLSPEYRFEFLDPSKEEINDREFTWGDQITRRVSENMTFGYFSPEESVAHYHEYFSKWRLIEPKSKLTIKTFLKEKS